MYIYHSEKIHFSRGMDNTILQALFPTRKSNVLPLSLQYTPTIFVIESILKNSIKTSHLRSKDSTSFTVNLCYLVMLRFFKRYFSYGMYLVFHTNK